MKKLLLTALTLLHINLFALEVAAPKAPPSIPLLKIKGIDLKLFQDVSTEGIPSIIREKGDIYLLPVNVGATLYNKGVDIKFIGVTSNGLLSLVSREITQFSHLSGKKLYIGGQGSSPDVVTRKILEENNMKVDTLYRSSPEIAKLIMAGKIENAILPEPLATMVMERNADIKRVSELKELWPGETIPQVGIFVLNTTLQNNPEEVEKFLVSYKESLDNISDDDITSAIEKFNLTMNEKEFRTSLNYMNLTLSKDRNSVENYLRVLEIEVEDDFYGW